MREIEELERSWRDTAHLRGLQASLSFEKDGLVLGTTRLLARHDGSGVLALEGEEARVLTLLSVAYGRPVDASVLGAIRHASKHALAGNEAMAAMHLALTGLWRLGNPDDAARRLFIADGLLAKGVTSRDIFAALAFDTAPLDALAKFNPDEPRNPKHEGRISGEWTREGGAAGVAVAAPAEGIDIAAEAAATIRATAAGIGALAATGAASAAVGLLAFGAGITIPMPRKSLRMEGPVAGHPELRYAWNEDETELRIVRAADGQTVLRATLTPDGKLRVGPKLVGRKKGNKVEIDPFNLPKVPVPGPFPSPGRDDEPRLCPKETPDRPGRKGDKGEKDKDYEDQVKRWVNPDNPTKRGMGYAFLNPLTGNDIIFDDCQHRTGFLFDAKGYYLALLTNKYKPVRDGVIADLIYRAESQIAAANGRHIYWIFAEAKAAKIVRKLFDTNRDARLKEISIYVLPPKEIAQ